MAAATEFTELSEDDSCQHLKEDPSTEQEPSHRLRCVLPQSATTLGLMAILCLAIVTIVALAVGPLHWDQSPSSTPRSAPRAAPLPPVTTRIQKLAFGSCALQFWPQPFWDTIAAQRPDLFLMTGDNVYSEWDTSTGEWAASGCSDSNCSLLREAYAQLARKPSFSGFRKKIGLVPIWDDHDYGVNDGGAAFEFRNQSEQIFLDFWEIPASDPRRQRPGLYWSQIFGPPGNRLQLIVLDCRYFKSEATARSQPESYYGFPGRYIADENRSLTMLGVRQWSWLKEQLQQTADVRVLVSSLQVIADTHGWERWGQFAHERRRLLQILAEASGKSVIISGDRHLGGLYSHSGILEITSSSLTHTNNHSDSAFKEPDPHRLGNTVGVNNIGILAIDWESGQLNAKLARAEMEFQGWDDLDNAGDTLAEATISLKSRRGHLQSWRSDGCTEPTQRSEWKDLGFINK